METVLREPVPVEALAGEHRQRYFRWRRQADVLAEAQERFPEAGILMVSVEDCDDETSQCDISFFTNMGSDEVADVVKTIPDWEDTSPKVRH